jgi:hypothetical protein
MCKILRYRLDHKKKFSFFKNVGSLFFCGLCLGIASQVLIKKSNLWLKSKNPPLLGELISLHFNR